jgi:hypothetical protein
MKEETKKNTTQQNTTHNKIIPKNQNSTKMKGNKLKHNFRRKKYGTLFVCLFVCLFLWFGFFSVFDFLFSQRQFKRFPTQHDDLIHDVSFDYYGRRIATCSSDQTIKVFDLNENGEWELNATLPIVSLL